MLRKTMFAAAKEHDGKTWRGVKGMEEVPALQFTSKGGGSSGHGHDGIASKILDLGLLMAKMTMH